MSKQYLGDGVYIEHDGVGNFIVTTENGIAVTNEIVFELEVAEAFIEYVTRTLKLNAGLEEEGR